MIKKKRCCRNHSNSIAFFLIAIGVGLFLAYVIPRYLLITLLGIGLISTGVCFLVKK